MPLVGSAALTIAACGGGNLSSPDGATTETASPGACGDSVPAGQACNALQNMASPLAPSCATGAMPSGTGGTIVDGTYILTSSQLYGQSCSTSVPVAETMTIAGDCIQLVLGDVLSGTFSGRFVTQGNAITTTVTCERVDIDGAVFMDAATKTYTATGTAITLFNMYPDGSGDVGVFTRR